MSNPQPDQYTKFSNELFEKYISISRFLSPYENAVWLCIFRKTYGYGKKTDWLSGSQIAEMTGIKRVHVLRSLNKLKNKEMIERTGEKGKIFMTGIQKDYDRWVIPKQGVPKQVSVLIPKQDITDTQTGIQLIPKQGHTKDSKDIYIYIVRFYQLWKLYPSKTGSKKAKSCFLASVNTDNDWEDIQKALLNYTKSKRVKDGFVQNGSTWFNNWHDWIISPEKEKVW